MEDFVSASAVKQQMISGNYQFEFTHQSQRKIVVYNQDGQRIATRTELTSFSQLPVAVSETATKKLKKYIVDKIIQLDTPNDRVFEFSVYKEGNAYTASISKSGNRIKFRRLRKS